MDKKTKRFIDYVQGECIAHGVKFKPYKRGYIKLMDGVKCGGFQKLNLRFIKREAETRD